MLVIDGMDEVNKILKNISEFPKGIRKAATRSLNRTAKSVKNDAKNYVKADYNLKKSSVVKNSIHIQVDGDLLEAKVYTRNPKELSLISDFGAKDTKKGVVVKMYKKGSAKLIGKEKKRAFIVKKNGGRFVAIRQTTASLPLEKVYAPAINTMLARYTDLLGDNWRNKFVKSFTHEVDYLLKKGG